MAETSAAARLGQVISDRYRIEKVLGEGGMGAVYLAEHTLMRKRVALKLLHPELSDDEEVLARFKREAEAAAHIEHPNVATATDFGKTEDGAFYLVLEYVEGTSLRKALEGGALPAARALHIARQIALALERAHAAGIVHRDLKPENVMLVTKGEDADFVKVLDFGIARFDPASHRSGAAAQPLTRHGTILGTPEYMSPEQGVGDPAGPPADLYSVGVMLYEMLTGKHPFDATEPMELMSMHILTPVPAMSARAPDVRVEPAVEEIVKKLLEKEPQNRLGNARELVEAIEKVESATTTSPNVDAFAQTSFGLPAATGLTLPAKTEQPKTQARGLPRTVIVGGASAAVGLLLVVILAIIRRSPEPTTITTEGGTTITSTTTAEPPKPKAKTAGKAKIEAAAAQGPEGLEALLKEYPNDPQVHRALALTLNEKGRVPEALRAIRTMLALGEDGLGAVDAELTDVVVGAAGLPPTVDEAFALLEGPLGARGVDALIDIAQMKSAPTLSKRATRSLTAPQVRMKASPAAGVLLDMKAAKDCTAKKKLLERAKKEGDARMLGALVPMKEQRGCGFMGMRDCWPCLRKDTELDDTIQAIEGKRSK